MATSRANVDAATSRGAVWDPAFAARSLFAPLRHAASAFAAHAAWPTLADYNAVAAELALRTAGGQPLRFVEMRPKPRGGRRRAASPSYEERIAATGEVPTRLGSWHDFFNMLAWATFPLSKAALNLRQIAAAGTRPGRTREQDRLAMLDEGGILTLVPLTDAAAGDSHRAVSASPGDDGSVTFAIGHALYESVALGLYDVQGMDCVVEVPAAALSGTVREQVAAGDAALAARLRAGTLFPAQGRLGARPLRELL